MREVLNGFPKFLEVSLPENNVSSVFQLPKLTKNPPAYRRVYKISVYKKIPIRPQAVSSILKMRCVLSAPLPIHVHDGIEFSAATNFGKLAPTQTNANHWEIPNKRITMGGIVDDWYAYGGKLYWTVHPGWFRTSVYLCSRGWRTSNFF